MTEKIEIPLSKNKLFLGVGGAVLFVVLGAWLFLNADNFEGDSLRLSRNPIMIKGVGMIGVLFFGFIGGFGIKKLFDKKVGLTLDSNGITDHTNAASVGLIKWNDITHIETNQMMSTKFLLIYVTNPEHYIEGVKSGMKAKLLRSNMKMYGTPLSISSNTLQYDFKGLEHLVHTQFEKNKKIVSQ